MLSDEFPTVDATSSVTRRRVFRVHIPGVTERFTVLIS